MRRLPLPNFITPTGTQFETTERFLKDCCIVDTNAESLSYVGVPLTMVSDTQMATTKDELHCFVIGESGCGKTRRIIMPTIRLAAKSGRSLLVSDPKGEIYRHTADSLKQNGYEVYVINFRSPSRGHRWNPLGIIENLYRSGDPDLKDKAVMMLRDVADIIKQSAHSAKDVFWENSAAAVLMGAALAILEYGDPGELTIANATYVARTLLSNKSILRSFLQSLPNDSPITNNMALLRDLPDSTMGSVSGVFEQMCSMYTNQSSLLELFSTSDFDIETMGKRPVAVFFILPDDTTALYPIATVFVKQVYSALVNLADSSPNGKLANPVTFLLDEFANFATIPSVDAMLTAARSRAIRFVLVCQSMAQLQSEEKYRQTGAEVLMSNCRVWIYMNCRDMPFLERMSKLCGTYISPHTGKAQPLMSVDDLQHFEIGTTLVLNDHCQPMICSLPEYSKYDFGETCVDTLLPEPRTDAHFELINAPRLLKKVETGQRTTPRASSAPAKPTQSRSSDLKSRIEETLKKRETQTDKPQSSPPAAPRAESTVQNTPAAPAEVSPDSEFDLFIAGRLDDAIECCMKKFHAASAPSPNLQNNLAMLLRYGRKNPSPSNEKYPFDIPTLLAPGVAVDSPFARLNMALYLMEKKDYAGVRAQLRELSRMDWLATARGFWYPRLWIARKDPEGALVCLWANHYCRMDFNDIQTLTGAATAHYGASVIRATLQESASDNPPSAADEAPRTTASNLREKLANARRNVQNKPDDDDDDE